MNEAEGAQRWGRGFETRPYEAMHASCEARPSSARFRANFGRDVVECLRKMCPQVVTARQQDFPGIEWRRKNFWSFPVS